jgi:hypothetical protein
VLQESPFICPAAVRMEALLCMTFGVADITLCVI